MRLANKRAFISAAGQGIGRAIAERFAAEGAEVTATDLNGDLLSGLPGTTFALDVCDKTALQTAIKDAAPDILVNCGGIVHAGTIEQATDEDFEVAMALNVRAQMHAIQAALPGMQARGGGAIVSIASVASAIMGVPNRMIYSTSKAAVIGLIKSVARDYVGQGIRCNGIAPATVDSPSLHARLRATGDYDKAMADFIARQPIGRIAEAVEIADLAVYLGSDESRYMTGQCVTIDGGMSL